MKITRTFLVFIFVVSLSSVSVGQRLVIPLLKHLKGPVHTVKEVCYKVDLKTGKPEKGRQLGKSDYLFDTKSKLVEKNDYDSAGTLIERYVANYDDNENMLEETQYTTDSVLGKYKYRYDAKNNMIGWMSFTMVDTEAARGSFHYDADGRITNDSLFDAKGRFIKYDTYTFGDEGHLQREEHYTLHGSKIVHTYVCDMDGNRIQDTKTLPDGTTLSISRLKNNDDGKLTEIDILTDSSDDYMLAEKFKYNDNGRITEDDKYRGGKIVARHVLTYDTSGTVTADAHYGSDGMPLNKTIFTFDGHKNKTGEAIYKNDTLVEKWAYKYDDKNNRVEVDHTKGNKEWKTETEYDRNGNPVKELVYKNGKPVSITERQVVYY